MGPTLSLHWTVHSGELLLPYKDMLGWARPNALSWFGLASVSRRALEKPGMNSSGKPRGDEEAAHLEEGHHSVSPAHPGISFSFEHFMLFES